MTDEKRFPEIPKKSRALIKRQRLAVVITAAVVVLLAVTFALVWFFTTRVTFTDVDGTKYYAVKKEGEYVFRDTDKNVCLQNTVGNYITVAGTEVYVDKDSGKCRIVAVVLREGEDKIFDGYTGAYDILLFPELERYDSDTAAAAEKRGQSEAYRALVIASIEVRNETDSFAFHLNDNKDYEITGNPGIGYNDYMFASLVVSCGYTRTVARLDLSPENPGAQGYREHGYAEYGLPEIGETPTVSFTVTSLAGARHTIVLGDETPSGDGYYARYEGRDDVYVLRMGESSEYSYPVSETLFGRLEDFVTPLALMPMNFNNYFDITDFRLIDERGDTSTLVAGFSFIPTVLRKGTYLQFTPYEGIGLLADFGANDYHIDDCLQNLQMMTPLRTVLLDNASENAMDPDIFKATYGVDFELWFTYNAERDSNGNVKAGAQYPQTIYISPKNENGTRYLYNEMFDMVVEVSDMYLEFLYWTPFDWIKPDPFTGEIGYVQKIEMQIPDGTTAGLTDITDILLTLDNSASPESQTDSGTRDTSALAVYADYGDERGKSLSVSLFRNFYATLQYSSLEGMAKCTEAEAEAMRAAGDAGASLIMCITREGADGAPQEFVYRFYEYGGGEYSFVTVNGHGSFHMLRQRVDKIISDAGRLLAGAEIDPRAMDGVRQ